MIIEGLHEKGIFSEGYPFRLVINAEANYNYPLHWHNAVELVYILQDGCTILVNNHEYTLCESDILIITTGDTHSFSTKNNSGKIIFIFI